MTKEFSTTSNSDVTARQHFGLRNARANQPAGGANFDAGLWHRLEAMSLDDRKARKSIAKRLAAENKWTDTETARAITEYKRFLYLTQRAGFEATPSRPVDLVWHEHLIHTDHYWGTLCREVLRNDLHHRPGSGDEVDNGRLSDQYRRTLDAYTQAFGEAPPADIWPQPGTGRRRPHFAGLIAVLAFPLGVFALFSKIWPLFAVCVFAFIVAIVTAANKAKAAGNDQSKDRGGCGAGCGGGAIGSTGCADAPSGDSGSGSSDSGSDGGSSCGGGGCGGGD